MLIRSLKTKKIMLKTFTDKFYKKLNPILYFFWTTLKIKILFKRPKYAIGSTLYLLNYFFLFVKNKFEKTPYLGEEHYNLDKISVSENFLRKVRTILSKPNNLNFSKKKPGYVYYENYAMSYLDQVIINNSIDRKFFLDFLEINLGSKIRKLYKNNEYRVEHFWLIKTLNKDQKETYNLNSNYHTDSCMPGALKIIIYLCDVDNLNGPFSVKEKDNSIKFITGTSGTTIFFNPSKCLHAGSNTMKKERLAISYLIYPTFRKNLKILDDKPFLSDFTINPFTRYM